MARGQDSLTERQEQRKELARINKLTAYGPHRKNPLAAGRMLVLNAEKARKERVVRRRIPKAERRTTRSTFTSLRYREPARRPARQESLGEETNSG